MARWALLALCAALVCSAGAKMEADQAETDTPTFTTQTYAIVQNGEVVGMVHHVHAEAVFGRRGGPGDDRPPSPLALRLADLWSSQADALASLRDRLLATRCPLARQMALARLQLAAAAADAGTGEPTDSAELLRRWQRSEFEPGFAGMAEPAVLDWGVAEEELDVQQVAEQHVARELHHPMLGGHGAGHGMATRRPGRDGMLLPRLERDHRHGNLFGLTPDASQAPRDHPEDLVDFASVEQQLFGPDEAAAMPEPVPEHAEVEHAEEAAVDGTAGAGFLMPRRPAGEQPELAEEPALAGTTAGGAGFLMPRRPTGEARDAWGADGVDEELPVMALLMPRLAMDDHPPVVQTHPTEGGEEEAGEGVALLWKRLAGLVGPRPLPDVRGGGAPHPLPLHPRPAVHLNPAHMEPHHMPHPHHMLQHMPHPHHMPHHPPHAWPLLTETGELVAETPDGRWFELRTLDDPVPGSQPEVSWRLHIDDGILNWGLVTFVVLASACAGVWGALFAQYALYRSACAHRSAAAAFVTRVDSEKAAALQPLLHKGPVKAADKAAAVACAADHIAGGRSVTVLAYEPLGSSDK